MGFFRPDSEFMESLSYVADYLIINVLCVLFSLPIITAGAAFTARYYVSMKMVRGEEPQVAKAFMKSFKENFVQATVIWVFGVAILGVLAWDWYSVLYGDSRDMFFAGKIILLVISLLAASTLYNVFPFIARFKVTIKEAIKGAAVFSFLNLPWMVVIFIVIGISALVFLWYVQWALALWAFVTTVSLHYITKMYVKQFEKLEGEKDESVDCA